MSAARSKPPRPSAADWDEGRDWQRLHPLTPFFKGWGVIAVVVVAGLYNADENLPEIIAFANRTGWHWIALGLLALLLIALAWAFIWWRRAHFRITDTALEWATGVVFRSRRTARLDRIEAVDTIRPLIPRLFGLVKLKVESAGGADSAVELAYLKAADADRWRREILSRAALARRAPGDSAAGAGTPAARGPAALDQAASADSRGSHHGAATGAHGDQAASAHWATKSKVEAGGPSVLAGAPGDQTASAHWAATPAGAAQAGGPGPAAGAPVDQAASARWAATPAGAVQAGGPQAGAAADGLIPPKSTETQLGEFLGDSDSEAPELFAVPTGRVIASLALSVWTWFFVLMVISGAVLLIWGQSFSVAGVIAPILGVGGYFYNRLMSDFGFSAKQTQRGLTLSHGLTTRMSQTIRPGRVLAVELKQGPLWRRFDWWRARMTVAGYGIEDDEKQSVLVPVADSETVRRAIWGVAAELAQDESWEVIRAAMNGIGPTPGFTGSPKRARVFDPVAWRRTAFAVTPEALVLRGGRVVRQATIVLHGRIQGLSLSQGPFDRRRDLASVTVYPPTGPVNAQVRHLASADALALLKGEAERLNASMNAALATRPVPAASAAPCRLVAAVPPNAEPPQFAPIPAAAATAPADAPATPVPFQLAPGPSAPDSPAGEGNPNPPAA